jgi:hypothetical protein
MVDAKMRSECDEPVVPAITTSVFVWKLWKYRVALYMKVMTMFFPVRRSSHESWLSSSQLIKQEGFGPVSCTNGHPALPNALTIYREGN